jgi:hypothetical protein
MSTLQARCRAAGGRGAGKCSFTIGGGGGDASTGR